MHAIPTAPSTRWRPYMSTERTQEGQRDLEQPTHAGPRTAGHGRAGGSGRRSHHLLRFRLTTDVTARAAVTFGSGAEAGEHIWSLHQRQLHNAFVAIYAQGETSSCNNVWMRKKLLRAVGLAPDWRPSHMDPADTAAAAAASDGSPSLHPRYPLRAQRQRHKHCSSSSIEASGQGTEQSERAFKRRRLAMRHGGSSTSSLEATASPASPSSSPGHPVRRRADAAKRLGGSGGSQRSNSASTAAVQRRRRAAGSPDPSPALAPRVAGGSSWPPSVAPPPTPYARGGQLQQQAAPPAPEEAARGGLASLDWQGGSQEQLLWQQWQQRSPTPTLLPITAPTWLAPTSQPPSWPCDSLGTWTQQQWRPDSPAQLRLPWGSCGGASEPVMSPTAPAPHEPAHLLACRLLRITPPLPLPPPAAAPPPTCAPFSTAPTGWLPQQLQPGLAAWCAGGSSACTPAAPALAPASLGPRDNRELLRLLGEEAMAARQRQQDVHARQADLQAQHAQWQAELAQQQALQVAAAAAAALFSTQDASALMLHSGHVPTPTQCAEHSGSAGAGLVSPGDHPVLTPCMRVVSPPAATPSPSPFAAAAGAAWDEAAAARGPRGALACPASQAAVARWPSMLGGAPTRANTSQLFASVFSGDLGGLLSDWQRASEPLECALEQAR